MSWSHGVASSLLVYEQATTDCGAARRRAEARSSPPPRLSLKTLVFSECPGQLVPRQSATAELTFAARAILALDLDTTTSWALRGRDRLITSGTVSFRPGRHDGGGMRYPMMVAVDVKAVAALPASPRSFASHSRWTGCRCSSSAVGPGAIPEAPGNRDQDRLGAGVTGQHP